MCGGKTVILLLSGRQYLAKVIRESQSGTAFQAGKDGGYLLSEGILSFVEYAPRLLIVLPFRHFRKTPTTFTGYGCILTLII